MKRNNKKLDSKDPRYMTEEQEQIVNLILSNNELKSGKDVLNIFNELRGKVIQRLLDAEMEEFLGYDKSKHGEKENKNRRIRRLFICTSKKRFNKCKSSNICNAWDKQRWQKRCIRNMDK